MPLIDEGCVVSDISSQFFLPRELVINFNQLGYRVTSDRIVDPLLCLSFREPHGAGMSPTFNTFIDGFLVLHLCTCIMFSLYIWSVIFLLHSTFSSPFLPFSCSSQDVSFNLVLCILPHFLNLCYYAHAYIHKFQVFGLQNKNISSILSSFYFF